MLDHDGEVGPGYLSVGSARVAPLCVMWQQRGRNAPALVGFGDGAGSKASPRCTSATTPYRENRAAAGSRFTRVGADESTMHRQRTGGPSSVGACVVGTEFHSLKSSNQQPRGLELR